MKHPDLEKQLRDLKQRKRAVINDLTRKTVDAINLCEQASLTHMSLSEINCPVLAKTKTKKLKKDGVAVDEEAA